MKYLRLYENFSDYRNWKRNNVTLRGISGNLDEPNGNGRSGMLGDGLYTAPLSYKALAKQYGEVYFVVNGKPKNPKIFQNLNSWEIWFQTVLVSKYSPEALYPDIREFNKNTTIAKEMIKLGFDGVMIKGREMVNYTPKDVIYFKTEKELENYYINI